MNSYFMKSFVSGITSGNTYKTGLFTYLVLFICLSDLHGQTYVNKDAAFSITLPADWVQIPKDSIKNVREIKAAAYEHFDFLYKPKSAVKLFNYPHMLVQVIRSDIHQKNKDLGKMADWKLENITQKYLLGMDNKFYLEKSTGRVWQKSDLINITRISVFLPKKQYAYNIFFFSKKEDLEKNLPAFFSILASFKEREPELLVLNINKNKIAPFIIAVFMGLAVYFSYQRYPKVKK